MAEAGNQVDGVAERQLRLLVVMPNNRYINATEEEVFAALPGRADVTFYGPGYQPLDDLRSDLRHVYDELGPFDAVLLHQYHFLGSIAAAARECVFHFDAGAFCRRFPDFPQGVAGLPCPVILFLLRMDYYALDAAMAERIEAHAGPVLSWPAEFVPRRDELPGLEGESFAARVTDHYHHFAARNRHRLIPMMHAVGPRWFCDPAAGPRPTPVSVPGQPYAARIAASRNLGTRRVDVVPWLSRGLKALTGRGLHATDWGIDLMQRRFRDVIGSSRISYTDGSRLRWPVRKFFEIPALGAALVAEPFARCGMLGFIDGTNFLSATPETLPDVAAALLAEPERLAGLARAGHDMVRRRHSADVRAGQILRAIEAAVAGSFAGAEWRDGDYVVHRPGAATDVPGATA